MIVVRVLLPLRQRLRAGSRPGRVRPGGRKGKKTKRKVRSSLHDVTCRYRHPIFIYYYFFSVERLLVAWRPKKPLNNPTTPRSNNICAYTCMHVRGDGVCDENRRHGAEGGKNTIAFRFYVCVLRGVGIKTEENEREKTARVCCIRVRRRFVLLIYTRGEGRGGIYRFEKPFANGT